MESLRHRSTRHPLSDSPDSRHFTILDWNLFTTDTHNWDLFEAFSEARPAPKIYCNIALPEVAGHHEPNLVRRYRLHEYCNSGKRGFKFYASILVSSAHLFFKTPDLPPGLVKLQDCSIRNIPAYWAMALLNPKCNFVFYFHTLNSRSIIRLGRALGIWKKWNIRLACLDPSIGKSISDLAGTTVHSIPLAKTFPTSDDLPLPASGRDFRITIPGAYRDNKCFKGFAAELARALGTPDLPDCRITANSDYWTVLEREPSFGPAMARHAKIVADHPDRLEYVASVASADLLILPYEPADYSCQISAIVEDAMALGVPFAIPSGTLSQRIHAALPTCLGFHPDHAGDLGDVIVRCQRDLRSLKKAAAGIARETRLQHDPQKVVDALFALF
jgi:hypothetical protein